MILRPYQDSDKEACLALIARAGFVTRLMVKDGFAVGLDLYEMVMPLK